MEEDRAVKASLVLSTLLIALAAAYFARPILAPVTFALFTVAIVWPIQDAMQRRIPKLLALVVTLLATLATIALLGFLVIWAFGHVGQWLVSNTARFQALYAQAADWLDVHGVPVKSLMATSFSPAWITGALRGLGGQGYGLVSFVIIAFAFTVLGLLEVDIARGNIERLDNPRLRDALLTPAQEISTKFQQYMMVRSTMSALTGAVVWAFALVAGIELATAWGVIAFVLNYIPFIGPLIATIFPSLFALAQFESWKLAIVVFACLNFIQFFIGSYLEPRIAGARLSMSPFIVLFAVFFWSFLWGIAGAFIGVPILIAILTICAEHNSSKWLAVLMSGGAGKG
ncbi:AI-2E family transporter [Rhodoblastus acidophilus]|uniref:AI-2E family transporter n=1 Tax=Candidatus Rhodoblastus alkanivorans TaxID=2954117 RepID=A0ABS9Z8F1_9HYPH|nr:AI-2E family transporter [Candidatus Rhodoblastus alkanivorans]MCI4678382.1 AI-2E family transporter [Candidatus Rhodoblastus alkanivorans]MCI4683640.1 AI-2E family transporter [Candidatus Rhodoblastus alkanivorans]MDI4640956.1 AI-2E family transporter [Rhodoblastus acidophilus]